METGRFVDIEKIRSDLEGVPVSQDIDVITFSGSGEPTLAENLQEIIRLVRTRSELPLAILTNSSLLQDIQVRDALMDLDIVVAKLDAPDQETLEKINRPLEGIRFSDLLSGIAEFSDDYTGTFAVQMMFIEENREKAGEMADLAKQIEADEVQINTPLRPSPSKPLTAEQISQIENEFMGLNIKSVYESSKPETEVFDKMEVIRRRGIDDT
jgi:wyosine [tRNA(Phe)-imidazoG37] synthetase (radical SAM superfamily)